MEEKAEQLNRKLEEVYDQVKTVEEYDSDAIDLILQSFREVAEAQRDEIVVFVDRCARDKGMAGMEFDQWIKDTPLVTDKPESQQ